MAWSDEYLGLPWRDGGLTREGVSCWGLAGLVYLEQRGIRLPSYAPTVIDDAEWAETQAIMRGGSGWPWREVEPGAEREFDLVTFRLGLLESHVGVVTRPGVALHVAKGMTSHLVRYDQDDRWKGLRGRFLRHGPPLALRPRSAPSGHGSRLVALPALDLSLGRIEMTASPGTSVADMIGLAFPTLAEEQRETLRVTIDGLVIPPERWACVRPRIGRTVFIRAVPSAGFDARTGLLLAVAIAAIAVSAGALAPIAGGIMGLSFAAGTASASVAAAVVGIGGSLLINTVVPPKQPEKAPTASPVYAINGFQNAISADTAIPSVLGKVRFAPPYAALPYTENVGNNRFIVAAFLVGYGPVAISDIRIGRTPITNFADVQTEVVQGLPGDPAITLYPNQVLEEPIGTDLTQAAGGVTRLTASDVDSFEVEIYFQSGLYYINHDGHVTPMTVNFSILYRPVGTSVWTTALNNTVNQTATAFWRAFRITGLARAQYEVLVTRTTQDLDDADLSSTASQAKVFSKTQWSVLRSFRPESPFNFSEPMALVAVRIKATGQLSGTLDAVNLLASRICLDWNGSAWVSRETQNPASLARYVQQGPENAFPQPDADLDLVALQDWAAYCTTKGLAYNRVHDFDASRDSVLRDVCAAGRALPKDRGDLWTVIVDRPRTEFIDHISPRNSWGYSEEWREVSFPHAYRVKFRDETNDYVDAERIIPWPGYAGDITVIEELELPGHTHPDKVWVAARRRQYEAIYRRVSYSVSQDFEHLVTGRGDGARLSHDVLNRTQVAGRIRLISGNVIVLDELVTMVAGHSYQVRIRAADGTSIVRDVALSPGTDRTLTLTTPPAPGAVGDLVQFGEVGEETVEVIIKEIEVGENTTGALTLIPHAPEIDTLTDAEVPPAWTGRIGGPAGAASVDALTPRIVNVTSSLAAGSTTAAPDVLVLLAPGAGSAPVVTYHVEFKTTAGGTWLYSIDAPAGQAAARLPFSTSGFAVGTSVDIRARAVGQTGVASAFSATVTHVVGANDTTSNDLSPQNITASEALAAGDFVNIFTSGGAIRVRKANATSPGKEAHGYVLAAVAINAAATVYFSEINNRLSGLTPGSPIYLSTTGGGWTHTPPTGSANMQQWLGMALTTSSATFMARNPFGLAA